MNLLSNNTRIAAIIGNQALAAAIAESVEAGLQSPFVNMAGGETSWDIFQYSLYAAIRDSEQHPRDSLFRRLLEYGPLNPKAPKSLGGNGTILSDAECGLCIEFIHSNMINRFKDVLAKLLALKPCIPLVEQYRKNGRLPADIQLFWGESIQQRLKFRVTTEQGEIVRWGSYTKGIDGLLVEQVSDASCRLKVFGVVGVKSVYYCSEKMFFAQIEQYIERLKGGLVFNDREWSTDKLIVTESDLFRVRVLAANWKLSRECKHLSTDKGRDTVFPECPAPSVQTELFETGPNDWRIKLAWSEEALSQAAYEMVFWHMSEVDRHIGEKKTGSQEQGITPEEADDNTIKRLLCAIQLRNLSMRQKQIVTRLYNAYCFGYPLRGNGRKRAARRILL